jgi:hypothetical protein
VSYLFQIVHAGIISLDTILLEFHLVDMRSRFWNGRVWFTAKDILW